MGVWAMMLSGGTPVGNLIFGPAADEWGVARVIFVQGVMMAVVFGIMIIKGKPSDALMEHD